MTVGKPDFNLNSFGIQYKEKNVKYTEDLAKVSAIDGKTTIGRATPKEEKQTSGGQASDVRLESHGFERNEPHLRAADAYPKGTTVPVGKKPTLHESGQMGNAAVNVNDKEDERGLSYVQPSGKAPKDLKIKAAEIILKAILLKLDLMKTTGKTQGDVNQPVKDGDNREVFSNIEGNDAHQNPPPVGGGGFAGKGRRRMINGKKEIVPQTSEETVPKVNEVPTSKLGDVVDAKDVTSKKVTDAQKLITEHNPDNLHSAIASGTSGKVSTWNDGLDGEKGGSDLGGKASETAAVEADKEDKEDKFINDESSKWRNSPAGKKSIAAREKREAKIIAAGGTVNHAASEIDSMTDGMKELFKGLNRDAGEEPDGKTGFTGKVHENDGTVSDWQNGQHTVGGGGFAGKKRRRNSNSISSIPREVKTSISEINAMTDGMKELMKDIKPRDYSHGKCVNCGKKMNHQEHMAANHSFNNPKEGEKVCSDCFDKEQ